MKVKSFFLLILLAISCSCLSSAQVLSKFQGEFKAMADHKDNGDTSKSFSIAMKILVAIESFMDDHNDQVSIKIIETELTCNQQLEEIIRISNSKELMHSFAEIYGKLKIINQKCTNMDFDQPKGGNSLVGSGFQNRCALCVILTKVMENYITFHKKDVTNFIENEFCTFFQGLIKPTCQAFVHYAGPYIIKSIIKKQSPDRVCLSIGYCKNPDCKISQSFIEQNGIQISDQIVKPAPWSWLLHLFVDKFGNGHLPPFDLDNDTFSDISSFRGYNWRGPDCDQFNKHIYPGRKTGSKIIDQDCNGIFGINPKSRKAYEDQLCGNSTRLGIAVIGDSAGAHFSIPEKYMNVSMMEKGTFNDLLFRAANQLDIPHESAYTGNTITPGYTRHSVYKYLREWNLCNSNDYQNIAVNGGSSGNTWGNIKALKRDKMNDYPLLMFMQLIGNDVCSKSIQGMTKPAQFKQNILKLLNYLDTVVPPGSHLFILGLGDGGVLYDNLHEDIHPLNVTYQTVYEFLNCLKISPCWSWLNSNETVRNITSERARNLSKVYQEIIEDGVKFTNYDIAYYDFPTMDIIERKIMEGGDPKDLIQRCDGFHPNGEYHSYLADWIWKKVQEDHPQWIGKKNPNNQKIRRIFGLPKIN